MTTNPVVIRILKHNNFVNDRTKAMTGGTRDMHDTHDTHDTHNTMCHNNSTMKHIAKLYCDCDRKIVSQDSQNYSMHGGTDDHGPDANKIKTLDGSTKSKTKDSIIADPDAVTQNNVKNHLYPETNDDPFSDLEDSSKQDSVDQDEQIDLPAMTSGLNAYTTNQSGGYLSLEQSIVGKTLDEIQYLRNKYHYLCLE